MSGCIGIMHTHKNLHNHNNRTCLIKESKGINVHGPLVQYVHVQCYKLCIIIYMDWQFVETVSTVTLSLMV